MAAEMSSAKIHKKPVKVEIKTEQRDLHSLAYYADDRVELIKQVFSALKMKTIKNLAPDFLKNSPIEEVEELCLNELLGLSTKRLLSIINATKCPSDTESSSDSDVRNIEEHVSLEEISSDSETERNNTGKPKRAKKIRATKGQPQKQEGEKSVSVLELLELQARARAIRSQLALEPVAKIEVDSDSTDTELQSSRNKQANPSRSANSQKAVDSGGGKLTNGTAASTSKPIKLKRNFRRANREDDEECEPKKPNTEQFVEKDKMEDDKKDASEGKDETVFNKERSPSPDVITILPSPETLCISDSSDEDEGNSASKKSTDGKGQQNELITKDEVVADTPSESKKENSSVETPMIPKENASTENAEDLEDGEIDEEPGQRNEAVPMQIDLAESEKIESPTDTTKTTDDHRGEKFSIQSNKIIIESDVKVVIPEISGLKAETQEAGSDDLCHQNDDVISLGHDDLDEHLHETDKSADKECTMAVKKTHNINERRTGNTNSEQIDNDIITLDNSSDEESTLEQFSDTNQTQSWNSRWLKSNRVSKILATSRLGNRVRDKIKKSKKSAEVIEEETLPPNTPPEVFQSQYEDGSVQQYAEIMERSKMS